MMRIIERVEDNYGEPLCSLTFIMKVKGYKYVASMNVCNGYLFGFDILAMPHGKAKMSKISEGFFAGRNKFTSASSAAEFQKFMKEVLSFIKEEFSGWKADAAPTDKRRLDCYARYLRRSGFDVTKQSSNPWGFELEWIV